MSLLDSVVDLSTLEGRDLSYNNSIVLLSLTKLLSLINVSKSSGIVSEMNARVLSDAIRQNILSIEENVLQTSMLASFGPDGVFYSSFDSVSHSVKLRESIVNPKHKFSLYDDSTAIKTKLDDLSKIDNSFTSKRNNSGALNYAPREDVLAHSALTNRSLNSLGVTNNDLGGELNNEYSEKQTSARKDDRRKKILALFTPGVMLGIKDISSRIKGCSEKTIQRELAVLLEGGDLFRTGEKRWSKYSLKV